MKNLKGAVMADSRPARDGDGDGHSSAEWFHGLGIMLIIASLVFFIGGVLLFIMGFNSGAVINDERGAPQPVRTFIFAEVMALVMMAAGAGLLYASRRMGKPAGNGKEKAAAED